MKNLSLVQALNQVRIIFRVNQRQAHIVSLLTDKKYIDRAIAISVDSDGFIDSWSSEESYQVGILKYVEYEEVSIL
jgi:hypothetical protein